MKYLTAMFLATALFASSLAAQNFNEGEHFQRIATPVSVPDDRVQVVEAFAYPCPACRNFLPHITAWEEEHADYVDFRRLPIGLQPGWDVFARAYYTAEVSGAPSEVHEALFRALHDERRQFRSFEQVADFYAEHGMDRDAFINTSQSFAVDARMRQNRNEVRQFGIRSTPTVIVQGKWRVSPNNFNSYSEMVEAVEYLVRREAEELGLNQESVEKSNETGEQEQAAGAQ